MNQRQQDAYGRYLDMLERLDRGEPEPDECDNDCPPLDDTGCVGPISQAQPERW